jgi:predicted nucleotidyltransferase
MDLAPEQQQTIIEWAKVVRYITEVRLFGSRAKGLSRLDSYVDLAVTIVGDDTGTPFAIYICDCNEWEADLSARIGLTADIERYDREEAPNVYRFCQEASVSLYSRHA